MKSLLSTLGTATMLLTACAPQAEKPHVIRTEVSASEIQAQEEAAGRSRDGYVGRCGV